MVVLSSQLWILFLTLLISTSPHSCSSAYVPGTNAQLQAAVDTCSINLPKAPTRGANDCGTVVHAAFIKGDVAFEAIANALAASQKAGLLLAVSAVETHVFESEAEYRKSEWSPSFKKVNGNSRNLLVVFPSDAKKAKRRVGFGENLDGAFSAIAKDASRARREQLIESLNLVPHPEGGYFREVYRALAPVMESKGLTDDRGALMPTPDREGGKRNTMTSIHWLSTDDKPKLFWGINKSDHVHYYEDGHAFAYTLVSPKGKIETHILGPDVAAGHLRQMVVPGGYMKAGHLLGSYCLIGEAVAPGFDFRDFTWVTGSMLSALVPEKFFKDHQDLLHETGDRDFQMFYKKKVTLGPPRPPERV